jgi:hypothetical protein
MRGDRLRAVEAGRLCMGLAPVIVRRCDGLEVSGDDMRRGDQLRRVLFIGSPQMRADLIRGLRDLDAHTGERVCIGWPRGKPRCGLYLQSVGRFFALRGLAAGFLRRSQFVLRASFRSSRSICDWTRRTASS